MLEPNYSTFRTLISSILNQCKNIKDVKKIHVQILKSPHFSENDRYFLTTRLIYFCAISKLGSLSYATKIFNYFERSNLFVYNALIRAYATKLNNGQSLNSCQSLKFYVKMLRNCINPNNITFPFVIKECTRRFDVFNGMAVYTHVLKLGFNDDLYIQNCMINLWCEFGFLGYAYKVFDEMVVRDVVSWNSMIVGCLRNGEIDLGFSLFRKMEKRSIYSWNSMISGLVRGGKPRVALELFQEMLMVGGDGDGVIRPDEVTIASVVSGCALLGAFHYGDWVCDYIKRSGLKIDMVVATSLIDMYGKCGVVDKAIEIFREMPKKDVMAWTAMISVYALHGNGKEALELLNEMDVHGVKPNHVTFVGILSACAHAGLVEEGRCCFEMMTRVYSIEPRVYHYACMVDILSRAMLFDEAEKLINGMPMEPDAYVWGALLGGCQMHNHVELGEKVALKLIDMDPLNHAFYINLCDIYAKAGKFDEVKKFRTFMQEKGISKDMPGSSMIEVDDIVYEFSVRGSIELVMVEILWLLSRLHNDMKIGQEGNDLHDE